MRMLCVLVLAMGCYTSSSAPPAAPPPVEHVERAPAEPPPRERTREERAYELMEEIVEAFESAGTDCEKLAENLNALADRHEGEMKELNDFEKDLTPEQKEQWNERTKEMMERIMPAMTACSSNANVMAAVQRLAQ